MLKNKNGFLSFLAGAIVVLTLFAGYVTWVLHGDQLYREGPRTDPPSSLLLQDMFNVKNVSEESVAAADDLFMGGMGLTEDTENITNYFLNNPRQRVVVGTEFIYEPEFEENIDPDLSVEEAPDGFILVDKRRFAWTPRENQAGEHSIVLGATDQGGTTRLLTFKLYASEYFYLMGTDERGVDLAALIIEGISWSVIPGIVAVLIAIIFGVLFGAVTGYSNGFWSKAFEKFSQLIESIPGLILFFLAAIISNYNIYWIMVAVGIAYLPTNMKLIRDMVQSFVQNQFVESARELGFKEQTVLWRDIIWVNGKATIASQMAYCFAFAILAEVTISYLGIGTDLTDGVSWGALLSEGKSGLRVGHYWLTVFPALAVTISILGFYWLGDGLNKLLDHKQE